MKLSAGRHYTVFSIVVIALLVFFFSTKAWLPDDRPHQNLLYKQVIQLGDWLIRFQDATYDPASQTMRVQVLQKEQGDTTTPFKITAYLGSTSSGRQLTSVVSQPENSPDMCWLEVHGIPKNYYYVSFVLTSTYGAQTVSAPGNTSSDIFGDSGQDLAPTTKFTQTVSIDYRSAKVLNSGAASSAVSEKATVSERSKK